jgi:hypothetical protein
MDLEVENDAVQQIQTTADRPQKTGRRMGQKTKQAIACRGHEKKGKQRACEKEGI